MHRRSAGALAYGALMRKCPDAGRSDWCEGRGRVALVTGASSGIGRSYATLLAAQGFHVVAVARRAHLLDELRADLEAQWGVQVHPLVVNLCDAEAPTRIVGLLEERGLQVDYLVNNAGYGLKGPFAFTTWDQQRDFLQVLALAPIELTRRLAPPMVKRGWGRIVNVGSVAAAFSGTPQMVLYSGAKSMLVKFTEGLAAELMPLGVHCTVILPGYIETEFFTRPGMGAEVRDHRSLMQCTAKSPDVVVRQAYRACERGRRSLVNGGVTKGLYAVVARSPLGQVYRLADFLSANTL